ncbi:kinase-like domain-containing protein, partial [Gigaspora rosea]
MIHQKGTFYGVPPYIAPEIFEGKPYTKKSDIYSLGIIMWEIASGMPPFYDQNMDKYQLPLEIIKGKRPRIINGTPPEYVDLMIKCWDKDPDKRPEAGIIMKKM